MLYIMGYFNAWYLVVYIGMYLVKINPYVPALGDLDT